MSGNFKSLIIARTKESEEGSMTEALRVQREQIMKGSVRYSEAGFPPEGDGSPERVMSKGSWLPHFLGPSTLSPSL